MIMNMNLYIFYLDLDTVSQFRAQRPSNQLLYIELATESQQSGFPLAPGALQQISGVQPPTLVQR